ncbi:helix-turn-helix transcriptional regulator, partial [bacterium]|nr:helix-turn-helix transcriptional regulator [candidate division CSSED10-310 bacterium]
MAQYLKDAIRDRIIDAAAIQFANRGYADATVKDIAAGAGISTGNVYRYFPTKQALFEAVLPSCFRTEFLELLDRRFLALQGQPDIRGLPAESPYFLWSEKLLSFCITNRHRIIILLSRTEGTPLDSFAARMKDMMAKAALAHAG